MIQPIYRSEHFYRLKDCNQNKQFSLIKNPTFFLKKCPKLYYHFICHETIQIIQSIFINIKN